MPKLYLDQEEFQNLVSDVITDNDGITFFKQKLKELRPKVEEYQKTLQAPVKEYYDSLKILYSLLEKQKID